MYEDGKPKEAAYFLGQMGSTLQDPEVFRFNLSAFLSAARSIAQYALKEAQTKPQGQTWYEDFVKQDRFMRFFASKRDANIHDQIVQLDGHVDVYVKDAAHVGERALVEKFDRDGNLIEAVSAEPGADPDAEWAGSEEIPELSDRYLESLRSFVADGRTRGILSSPEHAA